MTVRHGTSFAAAEPEVPTCPRCKQPMTRCKCKDNDLQK